jgi:cation transport ATPase
MQTMTALTAVVFDKTGTITSNKMVITGSKIRCSLPAGRWWSLVAAAEKASSHWARNLVLEHVATHLPGLKPDTLKVDSFIEMPGQGLHATVGISKLCVGNATLLENANVRNGDVLAKDLAQLGPSDMCIFVAIDGQYAGYMTVQNPIRLESRRAVQNLRSLGIECYLV